MTLRLTHLLHRVKRHHVVWLLIGIALISMNVSLLWRRQTRLAPPIVDAPLNPVEYRTRLLEAIKKESLLESINNLAFFDDSLWALGAVDPDIAKSPLSFAHQSQYIPCLIRVRRLIEEAPRDHNQTQAIHAALRATFSGAVKDFSVHKLHKHQQILDSPHGLTINTPDAYWTAVIAGPASAFLLSEMKAFDALFDLADAISQELELPVNRLFLFLALHRLIVNYPEDALTAHSKKLRSEYLEKTRDIPTSMSADVLAWDAPFDERDVRIDMMQRKVSGGNLARRTMTVYPSELSELDDRSGTIDSRIKDYIESLLRFVESVRTK